VRFECPCHGSKYQEDGTYIEGPAPRDLDRFRVVITDGQGTLVNETVTTATSPGYGAPIPAPTDGSLVIKVDTGAKIDLGKRYYYQGGPAA
jgi:cytochrome b6-f complex iron-sulfur subunit